MSRSTPGVLLLSIRPAFADAIFRGEKTIELRRRRPRLLDGQQVFVYASGKVRALIGSFVVEAVVEAGPNILWRRYGSRIGIGRDEFFHYLEGAETGIGIFVANAWRAPQSVCLDELRRMWPGFVPPQSYRYVDANELSRLPRVWWTRRVDRNGHVDSDTTSSRILG